MTQLFYIYLTMIWLALLAGFRSYSSLNTAVKTIFLLIVFTAPTETCHKYLKLQGINANWIYHSFSFVEASLITLFFLHTIGKYRISTAAIATLLWFAIAVLNIVLFEPLTALNSNILLLESFCFISMAMYVLYRFVISDNITLTRDPVFRLWVILLFYWASSYFFWGYYEFFYNQSSPYVPYIRAGQIIINILLYFFIGVVFLSFSKPRKT
ncbi:MAG: hypothetical protein EOP56_00960 [Sphingobacteriales bacterium]|nr:MAG: hypothetical protein EOP56_00960 [Sphingobacteriales bacterium]